VLLGGDSENRDIRIVLSEKLSHVNDMVILLSEGFDVLLEGGVRLNLRDGGR
jgi:hypothetical protein